jgi:hypothetical protein
MFPYETVGTLRVGAKMNGESGIGRQEREPLNSEGKVGKRKQIRTENSESYMQKTRSHSLKLPRKCIKIEVPKCNLPNPTQFATRGIVAICKNA